MAAPVRIEEQVWTDPRYAVLAKLCGIDRWSARARVAFCWALCTRRAVGRKRGEPLGVLSDVEIDAAVEHDGFAAALCTAQLAERVETGVRFRGTNAKRTGWLDERLKAASAGGLSKASKRLANAKQTLSKGLPSGSGSGSYSGSGSPDPEQAIVARAEQPALLVMPDERQRAKEAVARVIAKLNERTSVQYQANGKSTSALVLGLLKGGYTEADLRLVIWHRAELWLGDAKMSHCLRPSTLFRRSNFEQYLPEAIAAAIKRKGALPDGLSGKGSRPTQQAPPREDPRPADVRAQGSFLDGLKGGGS